ncbi:MAG: 2,3-bisphosphoglycerate-independent phosphoglycerate mutase [Patescibacteria group bacterium]
MPSSKSKPSCLPFVLAIIDGWGVSPKVRGDDPTTKSTMPFIHSLVRNYPQAMLEAHGVYVGLPLRQDGNSEAGHLNLGAGRVVDQDAILINKHIKDGSFFKNPALGAAVKHVKKYHSRLHLMGLLSNYNSGHSSPGHILALLKFYQRAGVRRPLLHFFTDGRDSPRYEAIKFIEDVKKNFKNHEQIASIMGRFYAMDRKKDWTNTEIAYRVLTEGNGLVETTGKDAIRQAYNRGESDEFIKPTIIVDEHKKPYGVISKNDAVIFFNLRSDRARQLTKPFVQPRFEQINPGAFQRRLVLKNLCFVALTDFGPDLGNVLTAFKSLDIKSTLPFVLPGLKQLYVAESEKFAHITYFFNGGYDHPVASEDRVMVPSPNVAAYDRAPAMSSGVITAVVIKALKNKTHDFIVFNFANLDMVGHTGNFKACLKACRSADQWLERIGREVYKRRGGFMITADHGNIEETKNLATGQVDTGHSTNPVRCLFYHPAFKHKSFTRRHGQLADVAPTILDLLNIDQPKAMTGRSLFRR